MSKLHKLVLELCADVNAVTLEHPNAAKFEQEFKDLMMEILAETSIKNGPVYIEIIDELRQKVAEL